MSPDQIRSDADSPAQKLIEQWREGIRPDLLSFLGHYRDIHLSDLVAAIEVDQRERWRIGDRALAEEYLEKFQLLRADSCAALDLIFSECLLREQYGQRISNDDYLRRFPEFADVLALQLELHRLVAEAPLIERDLVTQVAGCGHRFLCPSYAQERIG